MNRIFAILFSLQLIMAPIEARADRGTVVYAKALSSIALGSTGTVALTSCNFAWSTTLFSVASIAMIAGDLLLADSYTDYQKQKKAELKVKLDDYKTENGNIQKEIIDQRLDMENQELKHVRRRKTLHAAVGAVLLIATILAIIENISAYGPVPNPLYIANGGCNSKETLKVLGIGVSKVVQMAWGAASSAGGGTAGAGQLFTYLQMGLTLATGIVSEAMGTVFSTGVGRAIFFGANSGLVLWVAADLSSRQNIIEDNIEKLKKVVDQVKKTETADGLAQDTPADDESPEIKKDQAQGSVRLLVKGEVKKPCLSIQSSGSSFGVDSCSTAIKLKDIKFPKGVNPLIASVSGNMVSATNDLANGDWDSAELKLEGVAAQASRIKDLLATVQKDHNDRLKAENKPTIDFDGEINKQIASLQDSIGAAAGIPASSASSAALVNSSPGVSPTIDLSTPAAPEMPQAEAIDVGLSGIATEEIPVEPSGQTASLDESLNQYESNVEDISKQSDVSIFKQVSNRYLLNYTKIFKEKKRIEVAP